MQVNFDLSLEFYEEALGLCEKGINFQFDDYKADSISGIGRVFQSKGKYDEALTEFVKALLIRENIPAEDQRKVGESLGDVAEALYHLARYMDKQSSKKYVKIPLFSDFAIFPLTLSLCVRF